MTVRRAGIALPLFSLRGKRDAGIGEFDDLSPFVDWVAAGGQRMIALLPLGELGTDEYSPYNALSSFALDPLNLCPHSIDELDGVDVCEPGGAPTSRVDRERARAWKEPLFAEAFARFRRLAPGDRRRAAFEAFRARAKWLADNSLFRAMLEEHGGASWKDWPEPERHRDPAALDAARRRHADRQLYFEYVQFVTEEAWRRARAAAAKRGVLLMGDLPFAPSENSADVWAHPELFDPSRSIGAPPDAFSETGQRWGLPMYRWQAMRESSWSWLRRRVRRMAELYDVFRVDHVVGLFRTFAFRDDDPQGFEPADEPAQIEQGREILEIMKAEAAPAAIVAEDLGLIPKFVPQTLAALGIPGYEVLRWERTEGPDGKLIDPLDYPECSIATTGTHDTDSLVEWWQTLPPAERHGVVEAVGAPPETCREELSDELRLAILARLYRSPSRYVVPTLQDLFGWPERINTPGTIGGDNWTYRLPAPIADLARDERLRRELKSFRRLIDASGRLRKIDRAAK